MNRILSPFWWLVIPVALIIAPIILELSISDRAYLGRLHSEGGPHEILQSLVLAAALIFAVKGAIQTNWAANKLLGGWFLLAAVCIFYVSGEEISWGQHILNWDTPSYWAQFNDQNETNLHNTSSWLDQKPRLLLFIGIVFGGIVVPALRRWKPALLPQQFAALYPPDILVVSALGVLLPYTVQELTEHIWRGGVFTRVSELQELYMYYFICLYLFHLQKKENSQVSLSKTVS